MPTQEKKQLAPTEILTGEFRVSYPYVFQPRSATPGAKPKYSITMLFRTKPSQNAPHEKVVDMAALQNAAMAAAIEKWGPDRAKWPKFTHNPFRSGTEPKYADREGYGEGVVFIAASSDYKPGVVDQNVKDIIDPNQFYPGCYARAKLQAYGWEYMGKAGVSFGLRHVQLVRDGEPLGGGSRPEDDFDAIPMTAGAPVAGGAPKAAAPAAGPTSMFGDLA